MNRGNTNRMNSGNPKSDNDMVIPSQASKALEEGVETSWIDTNLSSNTTLASESEEQFIKITNFENYSISNKGRVWSNYKKGFIKNRLNSKDPYPFVGLSKNNKTIVIRVHRLVAKHFIQNLESKPEVNHIDGNKLNNDVTNLEWVTRKENQQHAVKIGLRDALRGENCNFNKYKQSTIESIIEDMELGLQPKKISIKYNIPKSTINKIKFNKTWKHIKRDISPRKINSDLIKSLYSQGINNISEISRQSGNTRQSVRKVLSSSDMR